MWDKLSMQDRAKYIQLGITNGVTSLDEIREAYNKYAEGGPLKPYSAGRLVDGIYKNAIEEEFLGEPDHKYNFTISEEEADRLGYYKDSRGHRDDRVKYPSHPTHSSRGTWNGDYFELTEESMRDVNYTLFGMADGGQDPQAILRYNNSIVLPEITVTPKGSYIHNPYDNINIHLSKSNKHSGGGPLKE